MDKFSDQLNQDTFTNKVKEKVVDAESLLKSTAQAGAEQWAEARVKAEQSYDFAKVKLAQAHDELLVRAKAVSKTADVYVHDNPWRSIGIAASIGVVVGLLLARRS